MPPKSKIPVRRVPGLTLSAMAVAAVLLTGSGPAGGSDAGRGEQASGGLAASFAIPPPIDGIAPAQLEEIRAALAAHEKAKRQVSGGIGKAEAFLYPFFPQAGILGRDLFLSNYTDQNPAANQVQDWDCSSYTYDGHQGHDSLIRTFREQAIGVPIFAVLPGVVVQAHDGEPDMQTVWSPENLANLVTIDHGGGYTTLYLHMRRGSVAVQPGQQVAAGTQLGLTGSSGFSNWPHLHFETWKDGRWTEPSAGPCREGESLWAAQPPFARGFYVADFFMSRGFISLPDRVALLDDAAERTATFVVGPQTVGQRVDMRNLPAQSTVRLRVLNPRNKVVLDDPGSFGNTTLFPLAIQTFWFTLNLDTPGTWRYQLEINGGLAVNAPFRVVANARQITNRPPAAVKTRLVPARPVDGKVVACEVLGSLVTEDPDYDVVSYRYEWKVNNRAVRTVTSAALTDLLPAGAARSRDKVTCRVTASDGRRRGAAAVAEAIVAAR